MCGFAGFVGEVEDREQVLVNMMNTIVHRGPDSEGRYVDEDAALGFRRLSIIDLSSVGDQPLYNEDRSMVDVYKRQIVEFSELHDFMDVPVKNFSSGMVSRLAFAIATIGTPDILIVDEVLSVGDFRFQQKCEERIHHMMDSGTTILFVSHSIEQVKSICNKIVWLEKGKLRKFGDAEKICEEYSKCY